MPPENTSTPPTPPVTPEPPKQGFWAKLFGKKPAEPAVPHHESLAPPPNLGDVERTEVPGEPSDSGVTSAASVDTTTSQSEQYPHTEETAAPSSEGEQLPPTLDVPPAEEPKFDAEGGVPPTVTPEQPADPQPTGPTTPGVVAPEEEPKR